MSNKDNELEAVLAQQRKEIADQRAASNLALLRLVQHHLMVASVELEIIQCEVFLQEAEKAVIPECLRAPHQSPLGTNREVGAFDLKWTVGALHNAPLLPQSSVASAQSVPELRLRLAELKAVASALREASHQRCH